MSDDFEDDESHPIPRLNVIDVLRAMVGGGAAYGLVVARPLGADSRSMRRLQKKMDVYVEDFFSNESLERQGTPKPGKMWIYVHLHKDSHPDAFAFVRRCEPWLVDNGIKLVLGAIDDNGDVPTTIGPRPN